MIDKTNFFDNEVNTIEHDEDRFHNVLCYTECQTL